MPKKILFLLTLTLCAFVPLRLAVKAAITNSSRVIPYQGRLTDSGGNNVVDGSYATGYIEV